MVLQRAANLLRAVRRRFRIRVKHQRHPIAGWDPDQSARSFGTLKFPGPANDLVQSVNCRVLTADRKLRVADNIDEQDMRDFQLDFFFIGHKAQGSRAMEHSPMDNRTSSTTGILLRRQNARLSLAIDDKPRLAGNPSVTGLRYCQRDARVV